MEDFKDFAVKVPEILLPKDRDLATWSVIACDQYTQDEGYWNKVRAAVGRKASTLNLILPEVYLSAPDREQRIKNIKADMKSYLANGVFAPGKEEFVYIERKTGYGRMRHGLVAAIDLDCYEWKPFSKALIRATEATIPSRIPPRKEIRDGAPLESPHIMLLVNDPEHNLVEKTGELAKQGECVYDGDLMLDSGHITGWAVSGEKAMAHVHSALASLKQAGTAADGSSFLFAVGDGNHSLATAKAVWDEYKAKSGVTDSPVRYALVEIVNIYDTGLTFEPIHRVIFGLGADGIIAALQKELGGSVCDVQTAQELDQKVKESKASFGFVYINKDGRQEFKLLQTDIEGLAVSSFQPTLDKYLESHKDAKIDYIHGSDEVFRLGGEPGAVSVMLPPVAKDAFFATINSRGPLPRKSFSMGEASEKRFYLECRKLFN